MLRGWVNYFAHGHASRCFSYVRDWVEKKVRRHLCAQLETPRLRLEEVEYAVAVPRTLGLFDDYRVTYRQRQKALPV